MLHINSRWLVALPAKNEAERLAGALDALEAAAARCTLPVSALVLANDCEDETEALAVAWATNPRRVTLVTREVRLPPALAHAGGARSTAVGAAFAAFGAAPTDLLLTTDADARLAPDALSCFEAAFSRGADLALAKITCETDPLDPVSDLALAWGTPQVEWRHKVRQLAETFCTGRVPWPPLHDDYGGAGIACTVAAYGRLGGFRPVPSDEDKSLVAAADGAGLKVDRQSGAVVHVLARATGRAMGGMATALARNEAEARLGGARLVERHDLTIARLRAHPSHAEAFVAEAAALEPVEDAIAGIDRVLAGYAAGAA